MSNTSSTLVLLGAYNVDRYFMLVPSGKIIFPNGYPEKPEKLHLLDTRCRLTVMDVIRGIKVSLRYGLKPTRKVREKWTITMEKIFGEESKQRLVFQDDSEVREYVVFVLEDETSEAERQHVLQELRRYCPKLL